jgi:hypothetical protein
VRLKPNKYSIHTMTPKYNVVAYSLVAKGCWRCKQRPLLVNARNIHASNNRRTVFSAVSSAAVSGQRLGKYILPATDTNETIERCFLCRPFRDVISKGKSYLTVSQSVCLGVEPCLGLMTRYYLLFDSYCLVLGRTLSLTRGLVCRLSVSQQC